VLPPANRARVVFENPPRSTSYENRKISTPPARIRILFPRHDV
jgi:hypothetical protein